MTSVAAPRTSSWFPSLPMVTTKILELRKRVGIMLTAILLVVGIPLLIFIIRFINHAANPHGSGPAGSPSTFENASVFVSQFGFVAAALIGAAAGTTDLTDGVFRHLVITGRSRVALYLARIPAAIAIMTTLLATGFLIVCLFTSFAGTPDPKTIPLLPGASAKAPTNLTESQFATQLFQDQGDLGGIQFKGGVPGNPPAGTGQSLTRSQVDALAPRLYAIYESNVVTSLNPSIRQMVLVGLWLELYLVLGCVIGLGVGAVIGQRTVSTILLILLETIILQIAVGVSIPHFIDGQRLVIGVAMDQLRPISLSAVGYGGGGGGGGDGGSLAPSVVSGMPHWFMILVIVGWAGVWTVAGAWRMARRDT